MCERLSQSLLPDWEASTEFNLRMVLNLDPTGDLRSILYLSFPPRAVAVPLLRCQQ